MLFFPIEELMEYKVLIKFFSKLTTVFYDKDYLPHLVTARIITPDSHHQLFSLSSRDRAMRVLEYISYSLAGGEKSCFYKMLGIMTEQGNLHAQNLAEEIKKAIVSGVAKTYSLGSIAKTKSDSIGSTASFRSDSMGSVNTSISEGKRIACVL